VVVTLAAVVAAAEWLRAPSLTWVVIGCGAAAAALFLPWPFRGWRRGGLLAALLGLAGALGLAQARLTAIETHWPEQRERRVEAASRRLAGDLHAALHRADRLALAALATSPRDRAAALWTLDRLIPTGGPEMSVVVLDSSGAAWAWAGRHRLPPSAEGDSIAARATGYYVVLEARRHSADGRTAVAGVLVWAHPAVPDRARSLAELFRDRTEVGLTMYPPGTAPDSIDVFDYEEPTTAGPRLLFSAQPIPPEQGTAKERAVERSGRLVTWLALLALGLGLAGAGIPVERFALLGAGLWLAVRAPVGPALGVPALFSPGTFFRPLLGPLSSSSGVLALTGTLLTIGGVWLWRRRLPRRWPGIALGGALLLASPYLISSLGRGITPPAGGVSVGLWLSWQLAILVSASALIVPTAALSGSGSRSPSPRRSSASWSGAPEAGGPTGTPSCGRRPWCWCVCRRRGGPRSAGSRSSPGAPRRW
jgi:hypothetical protein